MLYSAIGGLPQYKVVVVGAPGVGKTSLVRTWAREPLPHHYVPTPGVSVHPVQIGTEAELIIHDVGGTALPRCIEDILPQAHAVVLMYDHSRAEETLGALDKDWIPVITARAKSKALFLLVACNVPVDPVTNRTLSTYDTNEIWWQKVIRADLKAVMSFANVQNLQYNSEVSRRQLYSFIIESLGK